VGVTPAPLRALLGVSLLWLCGLAAMPAWAQQGQTLAPTCHFHEDATVWGDLNGDGIEDFATFVGDPHYNDAGVEEFQSKWRDGQLLLIGMETADVHPDDVQEADKGSSVNLLTGQVIHWTGEGRRRRETKRVVSAVRPVPLQPFDHDRLAGKWVNVMW
jgi:hypothetical protein